jgi:hypothetical protein
MSRAATSLLKSSKQSYYTRLHTAPVAAAAALQGYFAGDSYCSCSGEPLLLLLLLLCAIRCTITLSLHSCY